MEISLNTDIEKALKIREPILVKNYPYWTAEIYGFGKQIREFACYPMHLPLCINTDHGISSTGIIYETEINSDAPCQFYHSKETVIEWRRRFKKPCYVLFSPFVFYRRKNNIQQSLDAVGTIAFPGHTTPDINDISNIEQYIKDLKDLPAEYHPVSICMHYHDINKGMHNIYLKNGFKVFTAGNPFDYNFISNFYSIVKKFKYSTSNMMMSCLFYSVELGIPHFIYGNRPILFNVSDINVDKGVYDFYQIPKVKRVSELFQGPLVKIDEEQLAFVHQELGLKGYLKPLRMKYVLYRSLITFILIKNKYIYRDKASILYRRLKKQIGF